MISKFVFEVVLHLGVLLIYGIVIGHVDLLHVLHIVFQLVYLLYSYYVVRIYFEFLLGHVELQSLLQVKYLPFVFEVQVLLSAIGLQASGIVSKN